ncbi:hypothetical protein K0M31_001552 [Melipona bicolor]|uniref:Uncharacterized protein n=1 Tax=Melipona bicolor TaxID=60889 RepID=A0AA40GFZ4_9HYME|nr:hypothetical protein K0M31_001552 [Melipona bicolor]
MSTRVCAWWEDTLPESGEERSISAALDISQPSLLPSPPTCFPIFSLPQAYSPAHYPTMSPSATYKVAREQRKAHKHHRHCRGHGGIGVPSLASPSPAATPRTHAPRCRSLRFRYPFDTLPADQLVSKSREPPRQLLAILPPFCSATRAFFTSPDKISSELRNRTCQTTPIPASNVQATQQQPISIPSTAATLVPRDLDNTALASGCH